MGKNLRLLNKIFSSFVAFLLVFQSFSIYFLAQPKLAYADEIAGCMDQQATNYNSNATVDDGSCIYPTSTPEPTETPTPTVEPTITPEVTITPTPEEPTPTPSLEPTPEISAEPTVVPSVEPSPSTEVNPSSEDTSTPAVQGDNSTEQTGENPQVVASVVNTNETTSTQGSTPVIKLPVIVGPVLTTNKSDYSPNEIVVFTGSGFKSDYAYQLIITSETGPLNFSTLVTTNDKGEILFIYQLDGVYRPNYQVEIKEINGETVSTVTFTDNVRICHKDGNHYNNITVDESSIVGWNGYSGHNEDIIPSFDYSWWPYHYSGKNWDTDGQATWGNGCVVPPATGTLTVIKHVVNTGAGNKIASNFSILVSGTSPNPSSFNGADTPGTQVTLGAGSYSVSEGTVAHYTPSYGSNCSGTMTAGGTKSCTVTNTYVPYCGDAHLDSSEQCDDGNTVNGDGCNSTCQIEKGTIKVIKDVSPDDNGATGWNFTISGPTNNTASNIHDGGQSSTYTSNSGPYTITETAYSGTTAANYTTTYNCLNSTLPVTNGSGTIASFTLSVNQNIVCTFTNTLKTGTLTATKYNDYDGNGIQALPGLHIAGEPGIQGWGFTLYKDNQCHGTTYGTGSTDGNGNLQFTSVTPGTYYVQEETRTGWSSANSNCRQVSVVANQNATISFGNYHLATITGYKYNDLNGDGFINEGEPFLSGWTIYIDSNNDGNWDNGEPKTTTDANGMYTFSNLIPGTYRIREVIQDGWIQITPSIHYFDVVIGQGLINTVGFNFGNQKTGSIKIIKDADPDTDNHFDFYTHNLSPNSFSLEGDNHDNSRTFSNLSAGSYSVTEQNESGWKLTSVTCNATNYTVDGQTLNISLNTSQDITCTFHNVKYGSIEGFKWNDLNGNGNKDEEHCYWDWWHWTWKCEGTDEPKLSGWTINLENTDGQTLQTSITDNNGNYSFHNVFPGTYKVCEVQQGGWVVTHPNGNVCQTITVSAGDNKDDIDFGNHQLPQTGTVIVHKDVQGPNGEDVTDTINNFTVQLDGGNSQTVTDNGTVTYNNVSAGGHVITESVVPSGYTLYSITPDGNTDVAGAQITVIGGQITDVYVVNRQNFGAISGYKFNSTGVWPISPWWIHLYRCNSDFSVCSETQSVHTNINGWYLLDYLIPGYYQVKEDLSSAYTPAGATSYNITLTPGMNSINNNFYNFKNIDITVCKMNDVDSNLDTTQDRVPLSGWQMNLITNGNTEGDVISQRTNENGCTTFTNLGPAEDYSVTEVVPEGEGWINLTPTTHDFGAPQDSQDQNWTFVNTLGQPGITIVKTNDKPNGVGPSQAVTYTLTLENTGNLELDNITVSDVPPGGFIYVPGTTIIDGNPASNPDISGGVLSWNISSLASKATTTIVYQLQTPSDLTPGTYTNYATCAGGQAVYTSEKEKVVIRGLKADCDPVSVTSTVFEGSSQNFGGSLTPLVLGASTEVLGAMLPATGSSTALLVLAVLALVLGLLLNSKKFRVNLSSKVNKIMGINKKKGKKNGKK